MRRAAPGLRRRFRALGNGDSAGLHHPRCNFNDDVIAYGTSYRVRLVETAMAG
jgi:hippurate hydrolase